MIGDRLKQRRVQLGITQNQVSEITGIKSTTISNYENNISTPSEENIYKLMEALKCDANYLFEWEAQNTLTLTLKEEKAIIKFRMLDEHGQKVVRFILNEESVRCESDKKVHMLLTGKGGSAEIQVKDPEGASEALKKLQTKHKK